MQRFDSVFALYGSYYKEIVSTELFYPTRNSTGFAERNLSVNFARAYQSLNPGAICWYEFQFGEKNDLHYDAVIIDKEQRTVLLVESKRLKGPKKENEIRDDVRRIEDAKMLLDNGFDGRIFPPDIVEQVYGVVLADIWTMQWSEKKQRYTSLPSKVAYQERFENETFAQGCLDREALHRGGVRHYLIPVPVRDGEGYRLASFVWKVK